MTPPLTNLTFWTLAVLHSISTSLVWWDGWLNLDELTLQLKFLCYLHTWHAHARGHLENALHIMGYLNLKHNSLLIFDPIYPDNDLNAFPSYDWTEFYSNVEEAIPPDMPPPLGKDVDLRMMVDSDHAGDKWTRHSRTGFIIFCNLAPVIWLSKQQTTI